MHKSVKILVLSGIAIVILGVAINYYLDRERDSALTQDFQEVLKLNNLRLESIPCHRDVRTINTGFCLLNANVSEIGNIIANLHLKSTYIYAPPSANNYFLIDSYLRDSCLLRLNSPVSKIDVYAGGRNLGEFNYLELYHVKSTGKACLGLKYPSE